MIPLQDYLIQGPSHLTFADTQGEVIHFPPSTNEAARANFLDLLAKLSK